MKTAPFKKQTPSRGVLRPRRRCNCLKRRRVCRRWAKTYGYPGSIHPSPVDGLNITICPGVSRFTEGRRG